MNFLVLRTDLISTFTIVRSVFGYRFRGDKGHDPKSYARTKHAVHSNLNTAGTAQSKIWLVQFFANIIKWRRFHYRAMRRRSAPKERGLQGNQTEVIAVGTRCQ